MAIWVVDLLLNLARLASNAILILEAQRLILALLKPATHKAIEDAEHKLFQTVKSSIEHLYVPVGRYKIHTLVVTKPQASLFDNNDHENVDDINWQKQHLHQLHMKSTTTATTSDQIIHLDNIHIDSEITSFQQQPVMVLLHGHSMSAAFFYRNFDHYTSMGFKVYAPDLLGWARSSRPEFDSDQSDDSVHFFVDSFAQWVDELNLSNIFLVGHSLGSYVAYEYACNYSSKVRHLTLITPAAITRHVSWYRAFYFSLTPQRIARRLGLFGLILFFFKYPNTMEPYVRHNIRDYTWLLSAQNGYGSGDFAFSNMIQWTSPWEAECCSPLLEKVKPLPMPVCLIGAAQDSLVSLDVVVQLFEAFAQVGNRCSLYSMNSDHCPHFEDAQTFASIMETEIRRCAPWIGKIF